MCHCLRAATKDVPLSLGGRGPQTVLRVHLRDCERSGQSALLEGRHAEWQIDRSVMRPSSSGTSAQTLGVRSLESGVEPVRGLTPTGSPGIQNREIADRVYS